MGMDQLPFWVRLTQHPEYDEYWQDQAVDRILARAPLTVPTLFVGSEWDQEDIYGAPAAFNAVKRQRQWQRSPRPRPLAPRRGERRGEHARPARLGLGHRQVVPRRTCCCPFLNQHLKGGPPADLARVTAFEVGPNRWERLADWPHACASGCPANLTPLYLAPGQAPRLRRAGAQRVRHLCLRPRKARHLPPATEHLALGEGSTWRYWLEDDQRFAEARPDVLTYATEPLTQPLTLKGTPLVHLVASTSGTDSDWVVKLIDVYPAHYPQKPEMGGYELAIAMDVMRGRYRTDPAHPQAATPNQPLTYEFALPTVDYVVQPGHRLMVQVQSSWFPLYDRNPQTFVPNIFFAKPSDYRAATQKVFTGSDGTWIGLPVVK